MSIPNDGAKNHSWWAPVSKVLGYRWCTLSVLSARRQGKAKIWKAQNLTQRQESIAISQLYRALDFFVLPSTATAAFGRSLCCARFWWSLFTPEESEIDECAEDQFLFIRLALPCCSARGFQARASPGGRWCGLYVICIYSLGLLVELGPFSFSQRSSANIYCTFGQLFSVVLARTCKTNLKLILSRTWTNFPDCSPDGHRNIPASSSQLVVRRWRSGGSIDRAEAVDVYPGHPHNTHIHTHKFVRSLDITWRRR